MWRNYLTTGVRALTKSRTYAFINIFGLALGLAACLLLLLYVRYETSYDRWLPDADRVFQVQTTIADPQTGDMRLMQSAPRPVGAALAKDFPQIEAVSKAEPTTVAVLRGGEADAADLVMADETFFSIIAIPFIHGDPGRALSGADSLVVSRSEAVKRFGTVDAVGETMTIIGDSGQRDLKVTGVFEDLPKNTHLGFNMVTRFKEEWPCEWSCINGAAYVKLRPGADAAAINDNLEAWEKRNIPIRTEGTSQVDDGANSDWRLVSLSDIHLSSAEGGPAQRPGNDRGTIVTFTIIALLILFMAIVNFTNLATARAGQRAREVALRKVLGARRGQLAVQFLGESLLLTAIAMLLALALLELALPTFAAYLDADIGISYFGAEGVIVPALALVLATGLVGGLYPAFYLSRYMPAAVLKANRSAAEPVGSGRLRNLLVLVQFAISIGLIACTIIIYHQTLFATRTSAGFDREGLLYFEGLSRPEIAPQRDTLLRQIEQIDGVTGVAATEIVPASQQTLYTMVEVRGEAEPAKIGWYSVEPEFFSTMRIPILAGRPLSEQVANDKGYPPGPREENEELRHAQWRGIVERGINIVVNEAAAERLGYARPETAIGNRIGLAIFGEEFGTTEATIVGIAANSRFRSLRQPVEPSIYMDTRGYRWAVVRYENADPAKVRAGIEQAWRRIAPQVPVKVDFVDAKIAEMYEADARRGATFAGFAILAVVIACLGLFGLAAFTAERRTKEIGVRKVFGATVADIVKLLAWQFSKPVVIANLIAWPIAWWVMRDWLNSFDARIALTPGPFVLAGLLALGIALGTIAGHAVRVARTNPIHALRYE